MNSKRVVKMSLLAALLGAVLTSTAVWVRTPRASEVVKEALGSDRLLLAADGRELQRVRTDFNIRRMDWRPLSSLSQTVQRAVLTAEDHRFYSHLGLDPIGLARATGANLKTRLHGGGRALQGGSTLTMQVSDLIREETLTHGRAIKKGSWMRKFSQAATAVAIETKWTKAEILEAYLNLIHLRGEFQGVPAASWAYFKKDATALNADESSVIAAMIASPNQAADRLERRACVVRVKAFGGDCSNLKSVITTLMRETPVLPQAPAMAPHLAARIFSAHPDRAIVTSTIDADLQRDVQAILEKNIARLKGANVRDTAAIVIENKTGRVLAYVGSVSTSESPHVDGVTSYRQAGSSLKPFLYGKAIDAKTLTAASILLDAPTAISWGGEVYRPTNYDKHFNGPVSVREALSSSLNVPAVKVVTIIGLHNAYQTLESLHFTHLKEPDFYGVSLALGAVDVRLDELANAYRTYANQGVWSALKFTNEDSDGASERIFSPEASYVISSILSDANSRAIGFGWESPLETPFWTAVKTGTSKDYRDNWCSGFSDKYTVAVWAGNFDSEAMHKVSGVSGVGPSWYEIMMRLHERDRSELPKRPATVVAREIHHEWESEDRLEYFLQGTEPATALVSTATDKRAQFIFPAEGSILVRDPHLDSDRIALFIRYGGSVAPKSRLLLDGHDLGEATSPFKLAQFSPGAHTLALKASDGAQEASVRFEVRGAN